MRLVILVRCLSTLIVPERTEVPYFAYAFQPRQFKEIKKGELYMSRRRCGNMSGLNCIFVYFLHASRALLYILSSITHTHTYIYIYIYIYLFIYLFIYRTISVITSGLRRFPSIRYTTALTRPIYDKRAFIERAFIDLH